MQGLHMEQPIMKPCPFCGAIPKIRLEHNYFGYEAIISIDHGNGCFLGGDQTFACVTENIDAWNKRAQADEEAGAVSIGNVRHFKDIEPDKQQALKPLEEAAEVFGAWQAWRANGPTINEDEVRLTGAFVDELCDTIQACVNLAASIGVRDLQPWMTRCEERNRKRGRL